PGRQVDLSNACAPEMKSSGPQKSISAGPWQESARTVMDFVGGERPVDMTVFLFQDGREAGFCVILRLRPDVRKVAQSSYEKLRAIDREPCAKFYGGLFVADGRFAFEEQVARVEPLIDLHGGVAGDVLASRDGPLNRRGAAVFGKQRRVDVN